MWKPLENLKDIAQSFFSARSYDVSDLSCFAGIDKEQSRPGECEFWFSMNVNGRATPPLPAVTSNPEVIAKLRKMEEGQFFLITAEENDGPMGTRVNAIEVVCPPEKTPDGPSFTWSL